MKKILAALLFLSSIPVYGQSAQRLSTALQPATGSSPTLVFAQIIPNAQISVCVYNTDNNCVTPVNIYKDVNLTQLITQPLSANPAGVYQYYIQTGSQVLEKVCAPYNQCTTNAVYFPLNVASGCIGQNAVANGCTGSSSFSPYGIIIEGATSISPLLSVDPVPHPNLPLVSNGSSAPSFQVLGVTAGGTGATSIFLADANLGISGPVFNIADYGAIADCTYNGSTSGCTDNLTFIQSAINDAYSRGGSVYIPQDQTISPNVYYISGTLNPKGVSIFSNLGGAQPYYGGFWPLIAIRGAPGLDVFAPGDPNSVGWVDPLPSFVWHDFGIIVDDSVDVSSTLGTNRKPGKTCLDTLATSSSAVITSVSCQFLPGDVGQNVTLTDGVNTLSTTIASIGIPEGSSGTSDTATLAATWTHSTHANSTLYVSVMNMATSSRVGNCALAYDDAASTSGSGVNPSNFTNMFIATTSGAWQNNSCGFFFQGPAGQPYNTIWDHIFNRTYWGYVFVEANNLAGSNAALGDFNVFRSIQDQAKVPWVSYAGLFEHIDNFQISTTQYGPQILSYNEVQEATPFSWIIENIELESADVASPGGGFRISGDSHILRNVTLGETPYAVPTQWDANASVCEGCFTTGTVNLAGSGNNLTFSTGGDEVTVNDTGFKNSCSILSLVNPFDQSEPSRPISCGVVNSRQNNSFASTPEFVSNGDETTPYKNQADLWMWPADLLNFGIAQPLLVADSLSETGSHALVPHSTGSAFTGINTAQFIVGQTNTAAPNFPATMVYACIKMKANSGSGTANFIINAPSGTPIGTITPSLTTTYGTYCQDVDLTGLSGDTVSINITSGSIDVDVAWISVHPWSQQVNTYSLKVGSDNSNPITGSWGLSPYIARTDGSGGSGDFVIFNPNGDLVDGPTGVSVPRTSASTLVNHAACIKSVGPPVVVGYCSVVVDSSGICGTCN